MCFCFWELMLGATETLHYQTCLSSQMCISSDDIRYQISIISVPISSLCKGHWLTHIVFTFKGNCFRCLPTMKIRNQGETTRTLHALIIIVLPTMILGIHSKSTVTPSILLHKYICLHISFIYWNVHHQTHTYSKTRCSNWWETCARNISESSPKN